MARLPPRSRTAAASPVEVELKLALDAAAAPALRRHPLVAHYRLRAPRTRELENRYVDTPALQLLRHGIELRLRREGQRSLQALKRLRGAGKSGERPRAASGLHRLDEWELPLRRAALDLPALIAALPEAEGDLAALLRAVAPRADLAIRVSTRYRRTTWPLRSANGDEVELALDIGEVQAGGRTLPLCEVEMELKAGEERSLFELALALQADLPLRPEGQGKAERGFELFAAAAKAPRNARSVPLAKGATVAAALRAIAEECLAQVQANEAGVVDSPDAEYVHQMRVGLRRLRSALGLFRDFASPPAAVLDDLRWSAERLGGARDAEVLAHETLARVPVPPPGQAAQVAWAALQAAALEAAAAARREAVAAVRSPRHVRWQLGLMAWLSALTQGGPGPAQLGAGEDGGRGSGAEKATSLPEYARDKLRRLRRRLLKRGDALPGTQMQARHDTRIAAKKLRYAIELLGALPAVGRQRRCLRALAALQQELGGLNDGEVAAALLARLAEASALLAPAVAYAQAWLAADAEQCVGGLAKLWRRLRRDL